MIDSASVRTVGSSSATSTARRVDFLVCAFATDNLLTDQTNDELRLGFPAESRSNSAGRPNRPNVGPNRCLPKSRAPNEPDKEQQQDRADRGVEDRCDEPDTKLDTEARQQPVPDEGTYN